MAEEANVALIQVHDSRGRLLLGKRRDTGKMTLPGGHMEPGELPEEGARCELFEETGMTPESLTLQRVVEPVDGRPRLYCFTALCIGEPHGANDPDQEVEKWEWVDIEDGIPEKFWDNLTGPPGDDNIVRQAYEPQNETSADDDDNRQNVSKSEASSDSDFEKVTRGAFLYLEPKVKGQKPDFAQCKSCRVWVPPEALEGKMEGGRCVFHGSEVQVGAEDSCGYWVPWADPLKPNEVVLKEHTAEIMKGIPGAVKPEDSGLVDRRVQCHRCAFQKEEATICGLYEKLNAELPDTFDLDPKIEPHACCNAQTPTSDEESSYVPVKNLIKNLAKFQPTPVFPKLGVPEDRRETPIVDTPLELRSKVRSLVSAEPLRPDDDAMARDWRAQQEYDRPSAGMVSTHPAYTTGYSMGNALRDAVFPKRGPTGVFHDKAPDATQLHENWHQIMNRVSKIHGHQKRAYLARNLYLSIPEVDRTYTDWFTSLRNQSAVHGKNPFHPQHYEEKIATLLNYLNNPGEREAYHNFLDHSPEERVKFGRNIKRAMKHLRRTAAEADESWLDPNMHPLTYAEQNSPDRPSEPRPTMSKPAPQPSKLQVQRQPTPKKPVDPRQQKLFEKAEPTYADYLEEPDTNILKSEGDGKVAGSDDFRYITYDDLDRIDDSNHSPAPVIQGYGMPGTYFEGEPCMYDSAEDCPDIDCSHHAELTPAKDPTDDPNGGQIESEVQALLRHPDPMERCLALKLASCSADDVTTAAFDSEPAVWQAALQHELAGPARSAIAASTTGPRGVIFPQHDHLLAQGDLSPEILEAMHHAVSGDPSLLECTRQDRLSRIASHPNFGAETMAKHDAASARHIYRSSTQPDLAPADASGEITMPHLRHLEEAYRHHAPMAPPMLGKLWSGGQSSKEVYNLPVPGHAEPRRFMVKPYSEFDSPLSGWAEATSQALYHAAGIGHLHQQSFVAPHGTGDSLVPATVIHLEDGELAGKEPPDQIRAKNPQLHDELRKIALMDLLTSNTDRAPRNLIVRPNGKPLAIDHALAFERGLKPTAHAYLQRAGGIMAVDGSAAIPSAYRETYKWWPTVAPQIRKAFADRLKLIRDQDVRAGGIRKLFEGRARWLDAAAKTAEAGQDPDVSARLESHRQLPWESGPDLSKKIDETHFVEGAAKMPLGHALENSGEHFAGKHPAAVAPRAAAFETHVMKAPHKVEPNFKQRGGADNSMGIEPKQVFHTPGGRFMVKAFHSKLAPYTGWGESVSQALYHAGGIGHLHQGSHVTPGESGEHGLVVHMAEGHTPMSQVTGAIPETTMKSLRQISLMDHLQGNTDRHADNLMLNNATGQPLAIDNGLAHNLHHRYASGRVSQLNANVPELGHTGNERLHFEPDAETWKWWQTAKEPVRKKFEEHLQSVTDPEYKERLRTSFMHRFNNPQGALQAPWWKRAKAALVGPATPNPHRLPGRNRSLTSI